MTLKCKICKKEDPNKKRVFVCNECKAKRHTCAICGEWKGNAKASMCQKCMFKSKEYKENMSKAKKGIPGWSRGLTKDTHPGLKKMSESKIGKSTWCKGLTKDDHPGLKRISEMQMGENNSFYGKTHSQEFKDALSEKNTGEQNPFYGKTHTEAQKNKWAKERTGEVYSKWDECNGVKVQSKTERKFVEKYHASIIDAHRAIKTPYGYYYSDFDFGTHLVEVKSDWTFKKMLEKETQINKIRWINNNIKKVIIAIENENGFNMVESSDVQ